MKYNINTIKKFDLGTIYNSLQHLWERFKKMHVKNHALIEFHEYFSFIIQGLKDEKLMLDVLNFEKVELFCYYCKIEQIQMNQTIARNDDGERDSVYL